MKILVPNFVKYLADNDLKINITFFFLSKNSINH